MEIRETSLPGVWMVDNAVQTDARGSFSRWFCGEELSEVLGHRKIVQINNSRTVRKGSVRGLHLQTGGAGEMKLVRCIRGSVFDVAVDVRAGYENYLRWHGEVLSAENGRMMIIPEGFAHGFQSLQDDCELLYLHTNTYQPEHQSGLLFNDPAIGIAWPEVVTEISERDCSHPPLGARA